MGGFAEREPGRQETIGERIVQKTHGVAGLFDDEMSLHHLLKIRHPRGYRLPPTEWETLVSSLEAVERRMLITSLRVAKEYAALETVGDIRLADAEVLKQTRFIGPERTWILKEVFQRIEPDPPPETFLSSIDPSGI